MKVVMERRRTMKMKKKAMMTSLGIITLGRGETAATKKKKKASTEQARGNTKTRIARLTST